MGNNMAGGRTTSTIISSKKTAKVMKIDGELLKLKTPTKVCDVIKDYPNHILLDSEEFLRFNLRANPLDSDHELRPRKIYLLVELPRIPSPLRRVRSGVHESTVVNMMRSRRSVSDLSSIMTRSTVEMSSDDSDGRLSVDSPGGPTRRLKMRLPKVVVDRIMAESRDEVEVAKRIMKLSVKEQNNSGGGVAAEVVMDGGSRGEERENGEERDCFKVKCRPSSSYRRKYKRLTS